MGLIDSKAVVLKTQDYRENDKLVWLYTEQCGKITCIAKGAKRSKSKFLSITLPLCYGEYTFFRGKNMANIQEGKILKSFQSLMDNLDKLTYATYVCELVDIATEDGEANKWLFREFITILYLLNTDALDYEILARSFELKVLKATGYGLHLDNCAICKKKISVSNYIDLSYYGGICEECNKTHSIQISKGAYSALRFLSNTPSDKIYRLNINEQIRKDIEKVNTNIISTCYARKPKSLEILNYFKE